MRPCDLLPLLALCALPLKAAEPAHEHVEDHGHAMPEIVITADPLGAIDGHFVAPVQVLDAEALRSRSSRSIGETVSGELGISSSDFGAAVGRPVIRGLGGGRVRVLQDGIGSFDLSTVSADHAVSSETVFAKQVEILRGPATLLYGSGASGGLVNVVNRRILSTLPAGIEGGLYNHFDSVSSGWLGAFELDAAVGEWGAIHADGLRRDTRNIDIPGFASTNPDADDSPGRLANSDAETEHFNIGTSFIGSRGFLGVSVGYLDNNYGVPGAHHHEEEEAHHEEGEEHHDEEELAVHEGTRIDAEQLRFDLAGRVLVERAHVHELSVRWGYNDYEHDEVEASDELGTRFSNEEWEGRVEIIFEPIGIWDIAAGAQFRDKQFQAVGEEAFVAPSTLDSQAGFILGKAELGAVHVDLGGRYEAQDASARDASVGVQHSLFSVSAGAAFEYLAGYTLGLSFARSERAPTIEELFAGGPHLATNTFELGNTALDEEVSHNIDLFWRKHSGRYRFDFTFFYNHIDNFVYLASRDTNGDGLADRVEADFFQTGEILVDPDELLLVSQEQQGADFLGVELEGRAALFDDARGLGELRLWADFVDGELDQGGSVPRLPPMRFGASIDYVRGPVSARFGVTRVTDQDDAGELESDTDGYTQVDLYVDYTLNAPGIAEVNLFARGTNLANETARRHTSFVKDLAPLPGRAGLVGARIRF